MHANSCIIYLHTTDMHNSEFISKKILEIETLRGYGCQKLNFDMIFIFPERNKPFSLP